MQGHSESEVVLLLPFEDDRELLLCEVGVLSYSPTEPDRHHEGIRQLVTIELDHRVEDGLDLLMVLEQGAQERSGCEIFHLMEDVLPKEKE